jgi:hypothetical protein
VQCAPCNAIKIYFDEKFTDRQIIVSAVATKKHPEKTQGAQTIRIQVLTAKAFINREASSLPPAFVPQVSSAEASSLEEARLVSQPEAALPDAARVSARDERLRAEQVRADWAGPQADAQFAPAAPRAWPQAGSVPAVASLVLERVGLAPADWAQAAPRAAVRYAPAPLLALWVQHELMVLLADLLPAGSARAVPPRAADWAEPEQLAVHSQQAAPGGLPACPWLASQVSPEAPPSPPGALPPRSRDVNSPSAGGPAARRDALPSPFAARQTKAAAAAESSSRPPAGSSPLPAAQPHGPR